MGRDIAIFANIIDFQLKSLINILNIILDI